MPRIVDETKMQRIKDATIELVVEKNYGGASISAIAKKAGVAEGYLYRYYSSKHDLILDLLYSRINFLIERLESLLDTCTDIKTIIKQLYERIFEIAEENPIHIKFIHVLMHNYNFIISDKQRTKIYELTTRVIKLGVKKNEINPNITEEEIFLITISYPLEFINMKLKNFFGDDKWTNSDVERLTNFCINALKK
ncbi:MAG: TetR/AcrR family transcriptional regulator [Bacteroidota bacterium]|nr:TetR/AcrR family transcriptional regulator [Bacteroidota bacterium]